MRESENPISEEDSPTITICPVNKAAQNHGWKESIGADELRYNCPNISEEEALYNCIQTNVFNLNDMVAEFSIRDNGTTRNIEFSEWKSHISKEQFFYKHA